MTRCLDAQAPGAIAAAVQQLAAGGLLGLPTETVYGLAADALNPAAVARVFAAKSRPSDHPLIVHLAAPVGSDSNKRPSEADWAALLAPFVSDLPPFAMALVRAFWPGPLTLLLPRREGVASAAAGGQAAIGLRCPAHPVAQAVLHAAQAAGIRGLAAPSANRFGRISPTQAAHVLSEFDALSDGELLVLDGGACPVGIESALVDASRGRPVLLRPGMLTPAQLEAAAGLALGPAGAAPPRASGTLASHYAPRARLRLMALPALQRALAARQSGSGPKPHTEPHSVAVYSRHTPAQLCVALTEAPDWRHCPMAEDPATCAHQLFAQLRVLDATGVNEIWVETPPEGADWDGVRDRLQRAAA